MTNLKNEVLEGLRAALRGPLWQPGDDGYEAARTIWNATIERRPALVAHCEGTADVMAAVDFARSNGLPLAVRGGGHNIAGNALCDDGLVIDLRGMRGVQVDPEARLARVEGGALLSDVEARGSFADKRGQRHAGRAVQRRHARHPTGIHTHARQLAARQAG